MIVLHIVFRTFFVTGFICFIYIDFFPRLCFFWPMYRVLLLWSVFAASKNVIKMLLLFLRALIFIPSHSPPSVPQYYDIALFCDGRKSSSFPSLPLIPWLFWKKNFMKVSCVSLCVRAYTKTHTQTSIHSSQSVISILDSIYLCIYLPCKLSSATNLQNGCLQRKWN